MASPLDPEEYLPFVDAGWSGLPEILQHGGFQEDPWDSDAEKPLVELAERESCEPPSQRTHSEPMLTPTSMASTPMYLRLTWKCEVGGKLGLKQLIWAKWCFSKGFM